MKKCLVLVISLTLILSLAGLAMADDMTITTKINGDMLAGYLKYPGYKLASPNETVDFDEGNFFAQFRWFNFRLITDVTLTEEFSASLVSQFEMFKDEGDGAYDTSANPVQNFTLDYHPGNYKVIFDAKGRDINIGFAEYLKLNVARRYARDGEPHIYRRFDRFAKQLTVEVPIENIRAIAVLSLEETDGDPMDFVGAACEVEIGKGKYAIGYKAEYEAEELETSIGNSGVKGSSTKSPIIVLAADYQFSPDVRLQVDFVEREEDGDGYTGWWRHFEPVENYPGTPFKMTNELYSRLTLDQYKFDVRLMKTLKDDNWKDDLAYWLDASYKFAPYTVGVFYRNYEVAAEQEECGDDYVLELYGKYDLTPSWRDSLKVFYRTNGSFGAYVNISFY